jgi:hypothetical protein
MITFVSSYRIRKRLQAIRRLENVDIYDDNEELAEENNLPVSEIEPEPVELQPVNTTPTIDLSNWGEEIEDPSVLKQMLDSIASIFFTQNDSIMSKPGETADCYALDNTKCQFETEEMPLIILVEYEPEPDEYTVKVKKVDDNNNIQRRMLKSNNCYNFNDEFKLLNREISCELKEYAHVISIKHIG